MSAFTHLPHTPVLRKLAESTQSMRSVARKCYRTNNAHTPPPQCRAVPRPPFFGYFSPPPAPRVLVIPPPHPNPQAPLPPHPRSLSLIAFHLLSYSACCLCTSRPPMQESRPSRLCLVSMKQELKWQLLDSRMLCMSLLMNMS